MYPWHLQHDVALASHTTLEVGGRAQYFVSVTNLAWLPELVRWAQTQKLPIAILGGGSNLVVSDQGVEGIVLHLEAPSVDGVGPDMVRFTKSHDAQGPVLAVDVSAACGWDALVEESCRRGAFDLACLSGIPGLCGAAPVQNIGAYGQSLQDSLVACTGVCLESGDEKTWPASELGLGYRTSYFKTSWQGRYVITRLHLQLRPDAPFVSAYPQLTEALAKAPGAATPERVRQCVLDLRAGKSMVWAPDDDNRRSVGSFFTNPIVKTAHAQSLCRHFAAMPTWPQGAYTKLSAAWLIEQAGFAKGWHHGSVGLSSQHTLALINRGQAKAQDIVEVAHVIQKSVAAQFGVGLWPEPSFWGFGPTHPLPAVPHDASWAPLEGGV